MPMKDRDHSHYREKPQGPRKGKGPFKPDRRPAPTGRDKAPPPPGGFDEERTTAEAPHPYRLPEQPVEIPPAVGVVHLRNFSYGTFIYERLVGSVENRPVDGDIVAVKSKQGQFVGWAFYNSVSPIALRIFSRSGPMPTDATIAARIARAVDLRRRLLRLDETTDSYRLIHAEGDGLSGLIADRFGDYVVIELFGVAMFRRLAFIQDAMIDAGLSVRKFIVRADKSIAEQEGFNIATLAENKDRQTVIIENGVKFRVMLGKGHKTGFFCDQRDNRMALSAMTSGRHVLDMCCYTGGFACYTAARGQASSVTAVDLDENSFEVAKGNAQLNSAKIEFRHGDAFDFLRQAAASGRKWDVVVLDPSKFVPKRDLMELGLRKYSDLNRLAAGVISPGGLLLTCSCSGLVDAPTFTDTVARAVRFAGRSLQILRTTGAGPDHPVMADAPEGAYLKAIWGRLD